MDPIYVPLISGLVGAIIGSGSSLAAIFIQARVADRRERVRQAVELAVQEYEGRFEMAKYTGVSGPYVVAPLVSYLHYYEEVLAAVEKGRLDSTRLGEIHARNEHFVTVARHLG